MNAQDDQVALPLRSHTILGVCEGLAEDFGFNPIFLRVPLAAMVLWNPIIAISTYFLLGGVVLASRLLFPKTMVVSPSSVETAQAAANEQREFAQAA